MRINNALTWSYYNKSITAPWNLHSLYWDLSETVAHRKTAHFFVVLKTIKSMCFFILTDASIINIVYFHFYAHLSRRLFWSKFVRCRRCHCVIVVVVVVVNFSHFFFFSRTTGPISTKLGTKHPWVKRIQVFFK